MSADTKQPLALTLDETIQLASEAASEARAHRAARRYAMAETAFLLAAKLWRATPYAEAAVRLEQDAQECRKQLH